MIIGLCVVGHVAGMLVAAYGFAAHGHSPFGSSCARCRGDGSGCGVGIIFWEIAALVISVVVLGNIVLVSPLKFAISHGRMKYEKPKVVTTGKSKTRTQK